jgi:hypothetical protein
MPGIESFGGIVEKATGSVVEFPALMRVALPGLLAACFIYPLIYPISSLIEGNFGYNWSRLLLFAGIILVVGVLVSVLSDQIYEAYEGRAYWPNRLREWGVRKQLTHARKLYREQAELKGTDSRRYDEIWTKLLDYPRDENDEPYAMQPTLLGNILYTYERYPKDRYGMDSVFYFPRIWMDMDKDTKAEIDEAWSIADGLLNLSAVSYIGGVTWIVLGLLDELDMGVARVPNSGTWTIAAGFASLVLGYFFYRLLLPFSRKNGGQFRSIFDLYRDKAAKMTELKPNEKALWRASWAYLQYGLLYCAACGKYNLVTSETCQSCHSSLLSLRRTFLESGKFPLPPV